MCTGQGVVPTGVEETLQALPPLHGRSDQGAGGLVRARVYTVNPIQGSLHIALVYF